MEEFLGQYLVALLGCLDRVAFPNYLVELLVPDKRVLCLFGKMMTIQRLRHRSMTVIILILNL